MNDEIRRAATLTVAIHAALFLLLMLVILFFVPVFGARYKDF